MSRRNSSNPQTSSLLQNIPEFRKITVEFYNDGFNSCHNCLENLNPSYLIRTQFNEKRFASKRHFDEIIEIHNFLSSIYNSKDFPDYYEEFPEFKSQTNPKEIEEFLNNLLTEPAFIHPRYLDFLRISALIKKPFLEFFSSIVPKKSLKIAIPSFFNKMMSSSINLSQNNIRRNSEGNADIFDADQNVLPLSMRNFNSHKSISFEVSCTGWEKGRGYYLFIFQLKSLPEMFTWIIKKSCSEVKIFHSSLEETLKRTITVFKNNVPKNIANFLDMDEKFLLERQKGLDKYMKELLHDKSNYDEILFKFIEFDIENKMPMAAVKPEDPLDYSLSDDEINRNNVLEEVSPIEFHSLKQENLIWIDENPGKRAIVKNNELWSPCLRNKRRVVSDINFNNVRIIFNGIKKVLVQESTNSGTFKRIKAKTMNGRMEQNYFINLEETEFSFNGPTNANIRTVIKLSKNYKELEEFNKIIMKNFENEFLPDLPDDFWEDGSLKIRGEARKLWEEYFLNLINIPMIEENQTFKEFFHLDKARNRYMYDSDKKETFRLDLTN